MSYPNSNLGFGQQQSYPSNPGYPPAPGGYPPAPGGYPATPGGYPPAPGGYPPVQGGYPPTPGGYPPTPGYSYPPYPTQSTAATLGYPPTPSYSTAGGPGYPTTPEYPPASTVQGVAPGYPPAPTTAIPSAPILASTAPEYQASAPYPPSAPGYPPSQGGTPGYPPAQGGTPGYPPAPSANYPPAPGYPGATPGYPGSVPGYPGAAPGYPPAGGAPPGGHGYPAGGYAATAGAVSASRYQKVLPQDRPTIRDIPNFDPSTDASVLRKAMKGFGTDEAAIIRILAYRTNQQRQRIIMCYQQAYGKDLIKDLKKELSFNFERVTLALMLPTHVLFADSLFQAMKGIGTNENTLVEILCTKTNAEMMAITATYQQKYRRSIQQDLKGDTSGHFRRLLISMTTAARDEQNMNVQIAPQLAQQLYRAGEGKIGTDEAEFNRILSCYSFPVLRATFDEYRKIKGKTLCDAIKSEFSGDIKNGLLAVVQSIENKHQFFAKCLNDAMRGMGTKDDALIRLIVTRADIDLGNIKHEFQRMYGKTLEAAIKSDTSGDYKKMLIALCDG